MTVSLSKSMGASFSQDYNPHSEPEAPTSDIILGFTHSYNRSKRVDLLPLNSPMAVVG
jgi:hypothetical protein